VFGWSVFLFFFILIFLFLPKIEAGINAEGAEGIGNREAGLAIVVRVEH
jgi:hypothetical protein